MNFKLLKVLILTTTFLLLNQLAFAQFDQFSCQGASTLSQSKGTELMGKVQNWYSSLKSLNGEFSQNSYLAALDIGETSSGSFWFKKTGLMRWNYVHPEAQEFIIKDKSFWLYRPADNQVLVDSFRSILISDLPIAFLMGIGDLSKDFLFISGCSKGNNSVIKLGAKSAANEAAVNELSSFALSVDSSGRVVAAQIEDVSGNLTTILFSELIQDSSISDDKFAANFPKGVDIYDRREEKSKTSSEQVG